MGLLDNNRVFTQDFTGLENSNFQPLFSNKDFKVWKWKNDGERQHLKLTYRDIAAWVGDNRLFLVKGALTDAPNVIEVNENNFLGLRKNSLTGEYPKITKIIACPFAAHSKQHGNSYNNGEKDLQGDMCRVCVIFDNGQIYHNYPSVYDDYDFYNSTWLTESATIKTEEMFLKFAESVVWDLEGRINPTKNVELVNTGLYYYNPALPDRCYEMHPSINASNGFGNNKGFGATLGNRARFFQINMDDNNANSFDYMGGYIADNRFTMIGTYRSNSGNSPARICVFGTQDGRNWYNMYEFGGGGALKYGERTSHTGSRGIPLAMVGQASAGLYTVKSRTCHLPSETDKEPSTLFSYSDALEIASITGSEDKITINTSAPHNFVDNDIVVIELSDGISHNNRTFDWLVNNTTDSNSGGNGVMFRIFNVTATSFDISLEIHNPHNNLHARHIHSINRCKDGVMVGTGEDYPTGGWIIYDSIPMADAYDGYKVDVASKNKWVRINSTGKSFSRPLGVILQQENTDTYCYVGVDTAHIYMNELTMPSGRSDSFKHNSCGVWKIKLEDMDNVADKALMLYNSSETCFGLQQILSAMVFVGQYGELAISFDNGNSWSSARMPSANIGQNLCHFSGPTYDRKFSIDNILIQLTK